MTSAEGARAKPRILIVEDEAHLADGIRFNLEQEGYSATVVGDGRAAVELLTDSTRGAFDLVILDLMLPEMSGFEVARRTRASGNFVAILILTAKDDEAVEFKMQACQRFNGCSKTLNQSVSLGTKPAAPDRLTRLLGLNHQRAECRRCPRI